MASLFEPSAGGFGGHGIADQRIAGFFDDKPLFEDF
ncbi:MAG: hypothetical protein RL215_470 [Planctomycetota bacterium]